VAIEIKCDGLAEPNPGHATWGWIAFQNGVEIASDCGYIGADSSNNIAEYIAVGRALRWAVENFSDESVRLMTDSKLVVNQIMLGWNCNFDHLRKLRDRCIELIKEHGAIALSWIPRERNTEADELSRKAYREQLGKNPPERRRK